MNHYVESLIQEPIKALIMEDLKKYLSSEILEKSTIEFDRSHDYKDQRNCYQLVTKTEDDTLRLMFWENSFAIFENRVRVEIIGTNFYPGKIEQACKWYTMLYNQDPNLSIKRGIE